MISLIVFERLGVENGAKNVFYFEMDLGIRRAFRPARKPVPKGPQSTPEHFKVHSYNSNFSFQRLSWNFTCFGEVEP